MRRALLILLGLLVLTWFEFQVYPGHSYLQGETQLLVPMLERLDTPGFLSRDLVASNPTFAYTIYDEMAQLLHAGLHLSFAQALLGQQVFFRFAALLGVFLLARGLSAGPLESLLLSGAINAITQLAAPGAYLTSPEATPVAFAFSLVLLAAGLLVHRMPLLSGLAAGIALLYDPVTAAAFWVVVIVMYVSDRSLRRFLRPKWALLIIFALLLGNLAQLQVGLGVGQELTARLSPGMAYLTQLRTPWVWVFNWLATEIWSYLFLAVAGIFALARIWPHTHRLSRWLAVGLIFSGLASVGMATLLLATRAQFAVGMPPARNLALVVAVSVLLCGAAGCHAAHERKWRQSLPWAMVVVAALCNAQVLDLLHLELAGAPSQATASAELRELSAWAQKNTWGSSMFQFPDAGKELDPGVFRALSRRSLWADWQSGLIADTSEQAGQEWWSRWQAVMAAPYSTERLQGMLPLPIDYYVLRRSNRLSNIKPVFSNSMYVAYDAQELRDTHGALR